MKFFRETLPELIQVGKLQVQLGSVIPKPTEKQALLRQFRTISRNVECPHNESHILAFVIDLLKMQPRIDGCIVEAGTFKGGSTAKFSIVAKRLNRQLITFDSFEGLPENEEAHDKSIFGYSIKGWFEGKKFLGGLEEVKRNIEKYGAIDSCRFIKGWYEDTMPGFKEKIVAAYLDVDLASSTKTCLKYLYPLIEPGGILYSQDGDFPLVIDVFDDDEFWETEVGCKKPVIEGLRTSKMLRIIKAG